jgi:hypothetical protein
MYAKAPMNKTRMTKSAGTSNTSAPIKKYRRDNALRPTTKTSSVLRRGRPLDLSMPTLLRCTSHAQPETIRRPQTLTYRAASAS